MRVALGGLALALGLGGCVSATPSTPIVATIDTTDYKLAQIPSSYEFDVLEIAVTSQSAHPNNTTVINAVQTSYVNQNDYCGTLLHDNTINLSDTEVPFYASINDGQWKFAFGYASVKPCHDRVFNRAPSPDVKTIDIKPAASNDID